MKTAMLTNKKSIESYVERQPSLTREVFSSLVANKSETTQKFVKEETASGIRKLLIASDIQVSPASNWMQSIAQQYEIEDLIAILSAASDREKKTLRYKLMLPFKPMLYAMLGFTLDLKLGKLSQESSEQVGDGMCLACFWMNLD